MSSSDSEAFESADEDFGSDERKSGESAVEKEKKAENVAVQSPSHESDNENKSVARKSSPEIQSKLQEAIDDSKSQAVAEEVKTPKEEAPAKSTIRKIEKPEKPEKSKPMKLGLKISEKSVEKSDIPPEESAPKTLPAKPKAVEQPPEVEDTGDWDFDDWGENDATESKKDEAESEDKDGWEREDWDDWEKPSKLDAEDTKKPGQNLYSVFPVLSEISQDSTSPEAEKSSGIFHNLSRMMKQPSQSSTYDTFPVLDELGAKQRYSEPPAEEKREERVSHVLDKLAAKETAKGQSWGWKPWGGFSTLLSTASEGVATLTHGLSSVIESGMGVPDPAELARVQKEEAAKRAEAEPEDSVTPASESSERSLKFGQIVSGVQQIGNKVISGGLDTLEGIGKKTMTILQENDPGLMNKRKLLGLETERPVLSQILREAKAKTEETERQMKQMHKHLYRKQLHFETLFDDYCGLVHLEALEILSKQCVLKLQSLLAPLTGKALQEMQETIGEVKELCELPEMDADEADGEHSVEELSEKFSTAVEDLGFEVEFKEILESWQKYTGFLWEKNIKTTREVHDKALHCLAETTALCVCKMHKLAELLLVMDHHSTANEADSLVQLTTIFCWHLNGISARFGALLSGPGVSHNAEEEADDPNTLITSIFLEGSNSTSYVQNAFQLFIPILQLGAA
ncbi:protein FAM114A2 [Phlebotomus argentipes]|uniref:protein FAM114A2 n=1 Tax=Phlebotomus argentipes TaxID=94469 RepID=UPI002893660E|nr:protein FAM114A2 [Phlebotomus argentipes]